MTVTDPTADRTITLPNVTGNVTVSGNPVSADGEALGSASLEWSDLYIADGGVIYFGDDQEIVLTHVADSGIRLSDSDKMLFGDGDDLEIYHDGSNSYILENGTGNLVIAANNGTSVNIQGSGETLAQFTDDGAATLYYDNSVKFQTSSAGVSVTGSMTSSGAVNPSASDGAALGSATLEWSDLFLADGAVINFGDDQDITITHSADTGLTTNGTFQATTITATTAMVPDASDGAALGTSALEWSDLFLADGAVINFGDDQDVTLTHVADTGLLLNSTSQLQFNDSSQYINAPSNAILDINATDEIELNATLMDINGNVEISGTTAQTGVSTSTAKDVFNAGMSVKNGSTSAGFVEFFEDSDNGSNKATLIGPSSTADVTLTLPAVTDTVAVQSDVTALAIALG